jgi:membrane dipeptidase
MLTRYEAEFTGRLIRDSGDAARWQSSPADGLCWGVIGVAGFDFLIRKPDDLGHLPALFERGVRVFQPVSSSEGVLGGTTEPGDDRRLSHLGSAFLARLTGLAHLVEPGPRPILDLAGMNAPTVADTLGWLDENGIPSGRVPLIVSHGRLGYRELFEDSSVESRNLRDLRSRGGVIGLTPGLPGCETADNLKHLVEVIAAMPFEGRAGLEGIAIGSDLLGVERSAPSLASARDITRWLAQTFEREAAAAVAVGNARRLLLRSAGVE